MLDLDNFSDAVARVYAPPWTLHAGPMRFRCSPGCSARGRRKSLLPRASAGSRSSRFGA